MAEFNIENNDDDPEGFYSCLRIKHDATLEEIQQAYYQACQIYHPDKLFHLSQEEWIVATAHMQKINMSYYILSDMKRRIAYTNFGLKGAKLLELIPADFSHDRILEALKLQERCEKRVEEVLRLLTNAGTGYISLLIDAHALLAPPIDEAEILLKTFLKSLKTHVFSHSKNNNVVPISSHIDSGMPEILSSTSSTSLSPSATSSTSASPSTTSSTSSSPSATSSTSSSSSLSSNNNAVIESPFVEKFEQKSMVLEMYNSAIDRQIDSFLRKRTQHLGTNSAAQFPASTSSFDTDDSDATSNKRTALQRLPLYPLTLDGSSLVFASDPDVTLSSSSDDSNSAFRVRLLPNLCPHFLRAPSDDNSFIMFQPPEAIQKVWLQVNNHLVKQKKVMTSAPQRKNLISVQKFIIHQTFSASFGPRFQFAISALAAEAASKMKFVLTYSWSLINATSSFAFSWRKSLQKICFSNFFQTQRATFLFKCAFIYGTRKPLLSFVFSPVQAIFCGIRMSLRFCKLITTPKLVATFQKKNAAISFECKMKNKFPIISATVSVARSLSEGRKLSANISFNPENLSLSGFFGVVFELTKACDFTVGIGTKTHKVELIYALRCGSHVFKVPVVVHLNINSLSFSLFCLFTALAAAGLHVLTVKPMLWHWQRQHVAELRKAAIKKMKQDHDHAMTLQKIMQPRVLILRSAENLCDGLVIISARYGCCQFAFEEDECCNEIDVTVPCQSFVKNSKLVFEKGTKRNFEGFYDVDPLRKHKVKLCIRYKSKGEIDEVEIDDSESLILPRSSENF